MSSVFSTFINFGMPGWLRPSPSSGHHPSRVFHNRCSFSTTEKAQCQRWRHFYEVCNSTSNCMWAFRLWHCRCCSENKTTGTWENWETGNGRNINRKEHKQWDDKADIIDYNIDIVFKSWLWGQIRRWIGKKSLNPSRNVSGYWLQPCLRTNW